MSRNNAFGGARRTLAHLGAGGTITLLAAGVSSAAAGAGAETDVFMRLCLIAMTACAANDVILIVWLGRGIEKPEADGPDGR